MLSLVQRFATSEWSASFGGEERAKAGKLMIACLILNEIRGVMVVAAAWPILRDAMLG